MELKELKKNLNKLDKDGFWMLTTDIEQILPLIENNALKSNKTSEKWYWVWLNKKSFGSKQRVKEFITVLNIKIKHYEQKAKQGTN